MFISGLMILIACSETQEKSNPSETPRRKKLSKLLEPKPNTTYRLDETISFKVGLSDESKSIDSLKLEAPDGVLGFAGESFDWTPGKKRVGSPKLKLTVFFAGKKETLYPKVRIHPENPPIAYTYRVVNTYPHDDRAYTQGLFWHDDKLWESTGKEGTSTMRQVDLNTGNILQQIDLDRALFGEGAAIHNGEIYQLTWHGQKGFVYNLNLEKQREFQYPNPGWGLTNLGDKLIMSDGTENLYIMDPGSFSEIDRLQVYDNQGKVDQLNELENVEGKIYANVYGEKYVVVIDPETGAVEEKIDFTAVWPEQTAGIDYVLNGIAYLKDSERLFVTGKYWPHLYEVQKLRRANQP